MPLVEKLINAFDRHSPPLNPLGIWVWEVMAENDMLGKALAPSSHLVTDRSIQSIKQRQG